MSDSRPHMGKVQALHRLHVLVAAQDRRFQRMAGFLLARAGFEVSAVHKVGELLSAVERKSPDIVIVDGTGSLREGARTAAVLEALHPGTTVVLVAEDERIPAATNLNVQPKWEAFDGLVARLERVHLGLPEARAEER